MMIPSTTMSVALLIGFNALSGSVRAEKPTASVLLALDVASVWSGHPVGFTLFTNRDKQFVGFYDAERRMTVAARRLDEDSWRFIHLPERIGWDSHNAIVMTADDLGYLHLSGNMHCNPLIYFRTSKPMKVDTFERIAAMVGRQEKRCTYPRFFRGSKNELLFTYRDGSSGNGNQIYNVYDPKDGRWSRLLDQPLTSGQGKMNAYLHGPVRGPDGTFHLCWVWRDTPDCATNHDLCYARSRDLVHWETSAGRALRLPITLESAEIVAPVPPGGGMINGNTKIGFDRVGRVILSFHKYDADGKTQLYNARLEDGQWILHQTSDWDYRWAFRGNGSIPFEIGFGPVRALPDGTLRQSYRHPKAGSGVWKLDDETLKPVGQLPKRRSYPRSLAGVESDFPGMRVRWCNDSGSSNESKVRYVLRWETLGPNRDRPRRPPLPPPSMLRLYKLSDAP